MGWDDESGWRGGLGAAGTWAAEGRGAGGEGGSYATGSGLYPVGRREPSRVIGQGVAGLERYLAEMTLAAGDGVGDWRRLLWR